MYGDFKGQLSKKLSGTLYTGLERTTSKLDFSVISNKNLFSAYMEITVNGEKVLKLSISRLIIEHHENNFRSFLPNLDRFDLAKKHLTLLSL
jgi:hypothetical protein